MIKNITQDFQLDTGNLTDVGKVREKNEDYLESFDSIFGFVSVVCDGMGGHIAGEVASRLAVTSIKEHITTNPDNITSTKQIISDSISYANIKILEKISQEPQLRGMGTTCVILITRENVAYYGHCGDSRLYMVRNNVMYQLTNDQSFVQTLVDRGFISYEEAEQHPRKNEITHALGISIDISPVISSIGLNIYKGDGFLLCSDGLSGMVKDETLQEVYNTNDAETACLKLVNLALKAGGEDNITLQIIKVVHGPRLPDNLISSPPAGAIIKKNMNFVSGMSPGKNAKTREIDTGMVDIIMRHNHKKKLLPFYIGISALILLFTALIYFVIMKPDYPVVSSKIDSTKTKGVDKSDVDTINIRIENYFKNAIKSKEGTKWDSLIELKQELKVPLNNFIKQCQENECNFNSITMTNSNDSTYIYHVRLSKNASSVFYGMFNKKKYIVNNIDFKNPEIKKPDKEEKKENKKDKKQQSTNPKRDDIIKNEQKNETKDDKINNKNKETEDPK
ncbi:MAG TPA: Stp1/IreP family PP2C-type Ser/Thr phosphatase [Ignavibacteria bacterium]